VRGARSKGIAIFLLSVLAAPPAQAASDAALIRNLGDAKVDWTSGVITARAGAAADLRLPGPEAARPAAVRRARERAAVKLRQALEKLPLRQGRKPEAKQIDAALGRAEVSAADHQCNGGVLLTLAVSFADLQEAKAVPRKPAPAAPDLVLSVAKMPLEVSPVLLVGAAEVPLGSASYRLGAAPKADKPLTAKRDRAGRLVVPAAKAPPATSLRGARAVIYVRTPGGR
jgi:hypothetical protein